MGCWSIRSCSLIGASNGSHNFSAFLLEKSFGILFWLVFEFKLTAVVVSCVVDEVGAVVGGCSGGNRIHLDCVVEGGPWTEVPAKNNNFESKPFFVTLKMKNGYSGKKSFQGEKHHWNIKFFFRVMDGGGKRNADFVFYWGRSLSLSLSSLSLSLSFSLSLFLVRLTVEIFSCFSAKVASVQNIK